MLQNGRSWRMALVTTGLALSLTACQLVENDARHVTDVERSHKINVSSHFVTAPIVVSASADDLAPAEAAKLASAVEDFARSGGDVLEIAVPKGTSGPELAAARAEVVRRHALRYGATPQELQIRYTEIAGDGPVVVSYERFVATPPRCGPTVDNMAFNPRNVAQDTYGCVTQNNLATMVANPADLSHMRRETPADSIRRTRVIRDYREGASTSSADSTTAGSAASF